MGDSDTLALGVREQDCVGQLARFFPQTMPVHLAVQVIGSRGGKTRLLETAIVKFGSPEHAIFVSTLPLEFDDHVWIQAGEEGRPTEASVVGVRYYEGRKAVAIRFLHGPCDWVVTQP